MRGGEISRRGSILVRFWFDFPVRRPKPSYSPESSPFAAIMSDVTNLSQDPFSGHVYASLASLEVVRVHPFTGEVESFAMMPAKGRVAVSPSGKLWFAPGAYLNKTPIISWDLPTSL